MKNLVSVLVPVYNVPERYLRRCIESLIHQTLKEIEIIIVDDGSTDNSGNICDEYANIDKRVKVIHQKNKGLSAARNTAFKLALGEYITFVDGDDWLSPEACEKGYVLVKKHDLTILIFARAEEYSKSYMPSCSYSSLAENKLFTGDDCKLLQKNIFVPDTNIASVCAKLIKRSYILEYNILHDETLRQGAEGFEFNLRLLDNLDKAMFVKRHWYHYTYNNKSISKTHDEKNHFYVLECFRKMYEFICDNKQKRELLPLLYTRLLYVINTTAISGYFNPENKLTYRQKVNGFMKYLEDDMLQDAMLIGDSSSLNFFRRLNLYFIERRWFVLVSFMAIIRRLQRKYR